MTYQVVEEQPHFIVIDDFLSKEDFQKIYHLIRQQRFECVHSKRKIPAFKITDGYPLWADPVLSHEWKKNTLYSTYPIGNDLDIIIQKIIQFSQEYEHIIGRFQKDWGIQLTKIRS